MALLRGHTRLKPGTFLRPGIPLRRDTPLNPGTHRPHPLATRPQLDIRLQVRACVHIPTPISGREPTL